MLQVSGHRYIYPDFNITQILLELINNQNITWHLKICNVYVSVKTKTRNENKHISMNLAKIKLTNEMNKFLERHKL
jgi:hypothetical protein